MIVEPTSCNQYLPSDHYYWQSLVIVLNTVSMEYGHGPKYELFYFLSSDWSSLLSFMGRAIYNGPQISPWRALWVRAVNRQSGGYNAKVKWITSLQTITDSKLNTMYLPCTYCRLVAWLDSKRDLFPDNKCSLTCCFFKMANDLWILVKVQCNLWN